MVEALDHFLEITFLIVSYQIPKLITDKLTLLN